MATASCVSLRLDSSKIELLDGALECVRRGFYCRRPEKKTGHFSRRCALFGGGVSIDFQQLLYDPQTSGGLFIALQPELESQAWRAA